MRGYYGKRRMVVAADAFLSDAEGKRLYEQQYGKPILEQAKVGVVLTLSAVAAIVAAKVLSPVWKSRR